MLARFGTGVAGGLAWLLLVLAPASALAAPGDVFVVDRNAGPGGSGAVFRVDPATGAQTPVATGGELVDPTSIVSEGPTALFVADPEAAGGGGALISIDPATGAQHILSSGGDLVDPSGVWETAGGCVLLVTDPNAAANPGWGDGASFFYDECQRPQQRLSVEATPPTPFVDPFDAVDFGGFTVVDANAGPGGSGAVFQIHPAVPPPIIRGAPPARPASIEVLTSGENLVDPVALTLAYGLAGTSRYQASPLIADPAAAGGSGAVIALSGSTQSVLASGGTFVEPTGVGARGTVAGTRVLVADRDAAGGPGALIEVDPSNGNQKVLSSEGSFVDPADVTTEPARCIGSEATFLGTPGPDQIIASGPPAVIVSLDGDDVILARPGDLVCAGSGNDHIKGAGSPSSTNITEYHGEDGNDVISGTNGGDLLTGNGGRDRVIGKAGRDNISGGEGNDRIGGGAGNDSVEDDFLQEGGGNDRLSGGAGRDSMSGGAGNDRMGGGAGNDQLAGKAGDDALDGGPDEDACVGGPGEDSRKNCERASFRP